MRVISPLSETHEQIYLFKWAKLHSSITRKHLMSNNAGDRGDARKGAIAQQMGYMKGVPDTFLAYPVYPFCGFWIELKKVGAGILESEQKACILAFRKAGYAVDVKWGWVEAKDAIIRYLAGEHKKEFEYIWK